MKIIEEYKNNLIGFGFGEKEAESMSRQIYKMCQDLSEFNGTSLQDEIKRITPEYPKKSDLVKLGIVK